VKDFFETGHTVTSTLSVAGGTQRANARMSVGIDNVDGYVPNNSFRKVTGLLSGSLEVTPRFSTNAVLQYARNNIDQRFGSAFLNGSYVDPSYQGGFAFTEDYSNENNTELLVNANHNLLSNLSVNAMVGGNIRRQTYTRSNTSTTGISVAGIYNVSNAAIVPTLGQYEEHRAINSIYGSAAFTLNGWWTVEGTARNDWSSTLPKGENSYFYPSVNTSVVLTDAMPSLRNRYLSFLKLRGSVAEVGNDAAPFQLLTTFQGNPNKFAGLAQFSLGDQLLEPNLKPEITHSTELGLEAGFFDGRASLDFTYYDKYTRNQIYLVPVSPTSGYSQKLINAGKMANTGFEALASVTPVQLQNFAWTATFNYAHNRNEVKELAPGVSRIVLGNGLFGDMRLEATKGQPYGSIWGGGYVRDDQGRILTDGGYPVLSDTFVYLGSIQPKWTGGLSNQFTYKNLSLNVLLDIRRGGKIMSYTNYVGEYSGVLKSTLRGREVDWNDPGIVVQGIDVDTGEPNTITVTSEKYFQNLFFNVEPYVYDASYTKLRELRLGFDLPDRYAQMLRSQAVSLALTGRNLKIWTDVPNIDPEFAYSSGNFQGVEYAFPGNTKSWGLSVRITP
jgi:outer membrane receptor protein involved in Fe transport